MKAISVIGCPRSGTTFLASLLGGHPAILSPPESQFLLELAEQYNAEDEVAPTELWNFIARHPRFLFWGVPMPAASEAWADGRRVRAGEVVQTFLRAHAERCGKADARFWVEHSPTKGRRLLAFERLFGPSQVIHIKRDGRAVTASLLSVDWGPNDVFEAASTWLAHLAFSCLAVEAAGERGHTVAYEELVRRPQPVLEELTTALGLEFVPAMLEGRGLEVPAYTRSQHALVGKAPSAARIDDWRTRLTPREVELFESIVGDALPYLGYTPISSPLSRRGNGRQERYRHELVGLWRSWTKWVRRRRRRRSILRAAS